jgi:large subunit ribosomal protein L29
MKIKDLRSMSDEELKLKLTELRKELIKSNAQIATGTTPKSSGQIKQAKKMIARILTLQKEKQKSAKKTAETKISKKSEIKSEEG